MPRLPLLRDPRYLLLLGLLLSWIVMLVLMRAEFWTLPSAELLERGRAVRPPTMDDLLSLGGRSAVELLALLLLAWPGRAYAARLLLAVPALFLYIVLTAPMAITSVQRVHRQWLALVALALLVAAVAALLGAAARALRSHHR